MSQTWAGEHRLTMAQVELLTRLEAGPVRAGGMCGWTLNRKGLAEYVPAQHFEITDLGRHALAMARAELPDAGRIGF